MQEKGPVFGLQNVSRKEVTILDGRIAKPDSMAALRGKTLVFSWVWPESRKGPN
jgi:hypothetical protein